MQQTIFNKLSSKHDIILLLSDIEEMKHIIKNSKGKKGKLNNKLKELYSYIWEQHDKKLGKKELKEILTMVQNIDKE